MWLRLEVRVTCVSRGTLFAVPFDPVKLETSGSSKPVLQQVSYSAMFGSAKVSFRAAEP